MNVQLDIEVEDNIQRDNSNTPLNYETYIFHLINALITTKWFYPIYLNTPERQRKHDQPSRLKSFFK